MRFFLGLLCLVLVLTSCGVDGPVAQKGELIQDKSLEGTWVHRSTDETVERVSVRKIKNGFILHGETTKPDGTMDSDPKEDLVAQLARIGTTTLLLIPADFDGSCLLAKLDRPSVTSAAVYFLDEKKVRAAASLTAGATPTGDVVRGLILKGADIFDSAGGVYTKE